ncbi:hypothetical protein M0804_007068 [Polistes exclamans]|nr:hypothetical protein M0804_007068 [Polistes exclamans]
MWLAENNLRILDPKCLLVAKVKQNKNKKKERKKKKKKKKKKKEGGGEDGGGGGGGGGSFGCAIFEDGKHTGCMLKRNRNEQLSVPRVPLATWMKDGKRHSFL